MLGFFNDPFGNSALDTQELREDDCLQNTDNRMLMQAKNLKRKIYPAKLAQKNARQYLLNNAYSTALAPKKD